MNPHHPSKIAPSDYYTIDEAATILKVSRKTIYLWIQQHTLSAVRLGSRWRIPHHVLFPSPMRPTD